MEKITDRQTVIIHRDLLNTSQWREGLQLNFHPDTLKIRDITYGGSTVVQNVIHGIIVPFIQAKQNLLVSFNDNQTSSNPSTIYDIQTGIDIMNGDVLFTVHDLDGGLQQSTADGVLSITLEFSRKEKQRKQIGGADPLGFKSFVKAMKKLPHYANVSLNDLKQEWHQLSRNSRRDWEQSGKGYFDSPSSDIHESTIRTPQLVKAKPDAQSSEIGRLETGEPLIKQMAPIPTSDQQI